MLLAARSHSITPVHTDMLGTGTLSVALATLFAGAFGGFCFGKIARGSCDAHSYSVLSSSD
eukprot:173457-Amphidinium_carterae.1